MPGGRSLVYTASPDLGSGFRIAMQDLEIRGAGELLGARQHGHIAAVGFDLYTRMLAQAVQEAQARQVHAERMDRAAAGEAGERQGVNAMEEPLTPSVTLELSLAASIP